MSTIDASRVWVPRDGLWVCGSILDADADATTVSISEDDDAIQTVPSSVVLPRRNNEGEESPDDLATLAHLDEPNILRGYATTLVSSVTHRPAHHHTTTPQALHALRGRQDLHQLRADSDRGQPVETAATPLLKRCTRQSHARRRRRGSPSVRGCQHGVVWRPAR